MKQVNSNINVIPVFNPSLSGHRIDLWLNKVKQCSTIYGWDDRQIIHFALQKLAGNAKTWFDSLPTMMFTWKEWEEKILLAFPHEHNYGKLLDDLLKLKYKIGDSIENYYYEKMSLLNQCKITGKNAVDCVVYGILDRTLRTTAQSLRCKEPEQLLEFLTSSKELFTFPSRSSDKSRSVEPNVFKTTQICFNCHERGHIAPNCSKPIIKCTKCQKIGHISDNCRSKQVSTQNNEGTVTKSTMVVYNDPVNTCNKYYKTALVNNVELRVFIDLGSEITILRCSETLQLQLDLLPTHLQSIKCFGNTVVPTLGEVNVQISVDGVSCTVKAIVATDQYINIPVLIGQDFTEQNYILLIKDSSSLTFYAINSEIPYNLECSVNKFSLKICSEVKVEGDCMIRVSCEPPHDGDLLVESRIIGNTGCEVAIVGGVYSFKNNFSFISLRPMGQDITFAVA